MLTISKKLFRRKKKEEKIEYGGSRHKHEKCLKQTFKK